ncbi:glycine cleavage system aminomethyltransferase GcvT [Chelativorans sp. Marseille-P2723]|uniref:glycine cleavage system aminomethyltransferase GcvT n=1 Tax=Chelativorans sp. Marseille-P2723 TaxID=2709133 RepID=UPI00156D7A30|nr:glycine cleavage system aminomethyltransferase GcvT [Chelativorans sp. Marseille-P2723]
MRDLKTLPLETMHEEAGARFGAFAGWRMPLTYPAGVMKEHQHTREKAGLFDISHMRLFEVEGADACAFLSLACPLDAVALESGRSKYSMLLNEQAGILDDIIVTRLDTDRFMIVANAGNAEKDHRILSGLARGFNVSLKPLDRVLLALQGPEAESVLIGAGLDLSDLSFMSAVEPQQDWFVTRSGYTGEDGFEIALPPSHAQAFVEKLFSDERVMWAGLAARDSLRLEAGLCLYGQDLDENMDPARAAILWAIPKKLREEGSFVGADALRGLLAKGVEETRVGLKPEGRQPVRAGAILMNEAGEAVGRVTSGGFGPSAGHPVAMGYVSRALREPGTILFADVRGNRVPLRVHPLPFMPHRYRKG